MGIFAETQVNEGENISFGNELDNRIRILSISSGKKIEIRKHISTMEMNKRVSKILLLATTCVLENAIWFSPDNGTIIVDASKNNDQIQIIIQNNGPIIEPTILDKIFNQGFSTRQSSGRGLAIAKKAVEEMLNGIIVCENVEDGQGVRFSIIIERNEKNE